jgi:hypothetical protein
MKNRPNEAHAVDAPIALLFHIVHPWRRATDAQCWATAHMKLVAFLLFIIAATQTICWADVTKLRPEDRKALEDAPHFKEVHATTNLPPQVLSFCADGNGRIAEPGQKWQVTDVILDDALPRKRLIWGAVAGGLYVVHYESGGMAHGYHVLVARCKQDEKKAEVVWHAVGKQLKDYGALLDAIKGNTLRDELDYAY